MKYRANITNLVAKSRDKLGAILDIKDAGYCIVSDLYNTYIECDSPESAELVECLNSNI